MRLDQLIASHHKVPWQSGKPLKTKEEHTYIHAEIGCCYVVGLVCFVLFSLGHLAHFINIISHQRKKITSRFCLTPTVKKVNTSKDGERVP